MSLTAPPRRMTRRTTLLALLLALALAAVGWGHRPVGDPDATARLAAYLQAAGDPAGLCGTAGTDMATAPCEACRLTDSPGLAAPGRGAARAETARMAVLRPQPGPGPLRRPGHPDWYGRAPPLA